MLDDLPGGANLDLVEKNMDSDSMHMVHACTLYMCMYSTTCIATYTYIVHVNKIIVHAYTVYS